MINDPATQTTPTLAQEEWLIYALSKLFSRSKNKEFAQNISNFIKANKTTIDRIRKQFSSSNPQVLGEGIDGIAFAISSHLVLKVFRSKNALDHAVKSMDRLHKNPEIAKTEAMIYDAGQLGLFEGRPVYYYIIEKMIPLENLNQTVFRSLDRVIDTIKDLIEIKKASRWNGLKTFIDKPEKHSWLKNEIKKGAQQIAHDTRIRDNKSIINIEEELGEQLKSFWLETLAKELIMKYLTNRDDLHMGNIGLTGYGDFRYFDPVYNEPLSYNL